MDAVTTQRFKDDLTRSGEKIPADIDGIIADIDANTNGKIEKTEADMFIRNVDSVTGFRPELIHVRNELRRVFYYGDSAPVHSLELSYRNYRFNPVLQDGPSASSDGSDIVFLYRKGRVLNDKTGTQAFAAVDTGPGIFVSRVTPEPSAEGDSSGSLTTFGPVYGGGVEFGFNPLGRLVNHLYFTTGADLSTRLGFIVPNGIEAGSATDQVVELKAIATADVGFKVPIDFKRGTIVFEGGYELARASLGTIDWVGESLMEPGSIYGQISFQVK